MSSLGLSSAMGLGLARRGKADAYAAAGYSPKTVADFVNGVYRVKGKKSDFASMFTFTRASSATYVDSTGTLQTVGNDVARLGHHRYEGGKWVNKGLLAETLYSATNNLLHSEDLGNAAWSDVGTPTVTSGAATALGGNLSLDRIEDDDAAADEGRSQSITVADNSDNWVASFFMKAGTASSARIRMALSGGTTPLSGDGDFDLSAGTAGTAGGDLAEIQIDPYGPDLYRCSARIANNTTGNTTLTVSVLVGATASDTGNILVGGGQLESQTFPHQMSSYIKTTTAAVTRAADSNIIPAANMAYSASAMSMHCDSEASYSQDVGFLQGFRWWNTGLAHRFLYAIDSKTSSGTTGEILVEQVANGISSFSVSSATFKSPGLHVRFNMAGRHRPTLCRGAADGILLSVPTTPDTMPSVETIDVILPHTWFGTIALFRQWDADIGDAGIVEVTS